MGAGESETGRSVFEVTPARSLAGQSVSVALEEAFCPSLFVKHQNTDTDARAPRDTFSKFDQTPTIIPTEPVCLGIFPQPCREIP